MVAMYRVMSYCMFGLNKIRYLRYLATAWYYSYLLDYN
jgi:hypothetical protein